MRQKTVVVSARGVGAQLETLPERWVPFHEGQREAGVIEGIGIQDVGLWCAHHLPLIDGAGLVPVTAGAGEQGLQRVGGGGAGLRLKGRGGDQGNSRAVVERSQGM